MEPNVKLIREPKTPLDELQNYLTALSVWTLKRQDWETDMLNIGKTIAMQEACTTVNEIRDYMSEDAWKLFLEMAKQAKDKTV